MALGGGIFTAQDKVLPGIYVNIKTTAAQTGTEPARGVVAVPLVLNWGAENQIFSVTAEEFQKSSLRLFGYAYSAPQMLALRELFRGASRVYAYRVTGADAAAAENTFATAKHVGTRGNDIKIVIAADADNEKMLKVSTYLGTELADVQVVQTAAELKANDFVTFKADATLSATAGTALTGGTDGAAATVASYQSFLDAAEAYSYNVLCCSTDTAEVIALFAAYTKRMREERGARFQTVVYKTAFDYEGVINATNAVSGYTAENLGVGAYGIVYWIAGATAGCALNRSNTNRLYDGELTVNVESTQALLEQSIKAGEFKLHNVSGEVRVLEDLNTLVTFTEEKGESFRYNQTVRAVDQLAIDIASIFASDYMGKIANNASGRTALWNDICKIIRTHERDGVFTGFSTDQVEVLAGDKPGAVVCNINGLTIAYAMTQLYLSISIS